MVTEDGNVISGTPPTTVTFEPDSLFAFLTVPTDDDSAVESSSVIKAEILNGPGYSPMFVTLAETPDDDLPTVVHTIYDNDLTFQVDDAQAGENAGNLDFTVRLNAPAPEQVTVDITTQDGAATSHANQTPTSLGQDFTAKTETVTFLTGDQTKTFSVGILDDTIHEQDETFTAELSNPPPYTTLAQGTATGTIWDDEEPMVARVTRTYAVVDEDHAGAVSFTVELSHPTTTNHERNPAAGWRTVPGTATLGEDYQGTDGKLTFMPGMTTGFIEVALVDDNLLEDTLETFTVELVGQGSRLLTLSSTEASYEVSIRDNETLSAGVTADTENVPEGHEAVFTVTLTGGVTTEDTTVQFEMAGSALAGDDYATPTGALNFPTADTTGATGTLTIPAGVSEGTITYPITLDNLEEDEETLEVELFVVQSGPITGLVSETQAMASSVILDEGTLTVSIEGSPVVAEGEAATFTVTMSKVSDENVSVDWKTRQIGDTLDAGETAEPDKDYTASSGTVAIMAGNVSATFTVQTTLDTLDEDDETFRVALEEATAGTSVPPEIVLLGTTAATGTITDDDDAPNGLTMTVTPSTVGESDGATDLTVTVSLDGTTQRTVDTPVTLEFINRPGVARNAVPGVDYTADSVNTFIAAGQSTVVATVTITPVDDAIAEDNEIARLTAKSADLIGTDATGITIENDDVEPVEVVITATPDTADESSGVTTVSVKAELVGQSSRAVDTVVTITTTDNTATAGEDFEVASVAATIPAGEMEATGSLSLTVLDDTAHEGDEALNIAGSAAGLTVTGDEFTIRDNDPAPTSIGLSVTATPITEAWRGRHAAGPSHPAGRRQPGTRYGGGAHAGGRHGHGDRRLHLVLGQLHPDHTRGAVQRHRPTDHHPGG